MLRSVTWRWVPRRLGVPRAFVAAGFASTADTDHRDGQGLSSGDVAEIRRRLDRFSSKPWDRDNYREINDMLQTINDMVQTIGEFSHQRARDLLTHDIKVTLLKLLHDADTPLNFMFQAMYGRTHQYLALDLSEGGPKFLMTEMTMTAERITTSLVQSQNVQRFVLGETIHQPWHQWNQTERLEIVQTMANVIANAYGLETPPTIRPRTSTGPNDPTATASYIRKTHEILVSPSHLMDVDATELLRLAAHETTHAMQYSLIDKKRNCTLSSGPWYDVALMFDVAHAFYPVYPRPLSEAERKFYPNPPMTEAEHEVYIRAYRFEYTYNFLERHAYTTEIMIARCLKKIDPVHDILVEKWHTPSCWALE